MGLIKIKGSSNLLPFLSEGERIMKNGVKKDVSRYGIGSESSRKDRAKSCKRPKKLASVRFRAKDQAIEIQKRTAQNFYNAQFQIEIHERAAVKNNVSYLASKEQRLTREQKRLERNKKLGRL